jgi:outer membrane protein assembly factor BamE (lipoprotein component of BamABCDE complex)
MRRSGHLCLRLIAVLLLGSLAGCDAIIPRSQVRGNKVDPLTLKELVPGTSTKTDAQSVLGSPTAKGSFDDNTWFYIGGITRPIIGGTLSVLDQEVVELTFDQRGILQDVKKLNQKDSLPVNVVSRETPSPGSNASFMQQLLGNVGKFNAGPASNSGSPGGFGGGPGAGGVGP